MSKNQYNQVGEVKGKASGDQEAFSFQFTPQNENLRSTRGSLFTLVTIQGKTEERFEKAKAYYHAFQSSYYAKASGSIINSLSETLEQLERDFSKKEEENLTYSLVAAVLWGAVLYLAKQGENGVWVCRGEKLKKLDFNKVASGVLEDADTVCLTTSSFDKSVSEEDLANSLTQEDFSEVLSTIDKKTSAIEGAAALVIRLAVGANGEEVTNLAIGEVDEQGETVLPKEEKEEVLSEALEPEEALLEAKEPEKVPETAVDTLPTFQPEPKAPSFLETLMEKGTPLVSSGKVWGRKLLSRLLNPWKKPVPGELVDHVAIRRQRVGQVVVLVVLILLFSVGKGFLTQEAKVSDERLNSLIASAQTELNEAKNIKTIDPFRAQSLVASAQSTLNEAKKLDEGNDEIKSLESQAASLTSEITRSYQVAKLETVFDFTKLAEEANIDSLARSGQDLLLADEEGNSVYLLSLDSKTGTKVEGSFNAPRAVAGYESGFYIQTQNEVIEYTKTNSKTSKVGEGSVWGNVVSAAAFQSSPTQNNLYLLDPQKGEIWRYLDSGSTLAAPQSYVTGDRPDFSSATGITIDDYVWVSTKNGTVYKFAARKKQEFSVSNMLSDFSEVVGIYTDSESKNLYILDKGKSSIVVLDKDGIYQAQYSHNDLKKAVGLVVREAEKTVYVGLEGKVVSLKLR